MATDIEMALDYMAGTVEEIFPDSHVESTDFKNDKVNFYLNAWKLEGSIQEICYQGDLGYLIQVTGANTPLKTMKYNQMAIAKDAQTACVDLKHLLLKLEQE